MRMSGLSQGEGWVDEGAGSPGEKLGAPELGWVFEFPKRWRSDIWRDSKGDRTKSSEKGDKGHPTPLPPRRGEKLEAESVANYQWFDQSYLSNEAFTTVCKDRVQRAACWWLPGEVERVASRRGLVISVPSPHVLPCASLPSGCSFYNNKPVIQCIKIFLWVLWATLAN